MSHKSDVKTKLNSKQHILKALTTMGYRYQTADVDNSLTTRGQYASTKSAVDILITHLPDGSTTNNEIGLQKQADGTYIATGDYYFARGLTSTKLCNTLTVEAKKEEVNDRLMALGFQMEAEINETSQEVEYTFTRWS